MPRRGFCLLCLLCTITISGASKIIHKNITVKGHITQTLDYCGGAMPSPEVLSLLKTPQAFAQKVIYIKIGSSNKESATVVKKLMTDEQGNFSVVLTSGMVYSFVEEWKGGPLQIPKDTEYTKWDPACFRERYSKADFVLKVKNTGNPVVNINYHKPCFYRPYCGEYSGPLPP